MIKTCDIEKYAFYAEVEFGELVLSPLWQKNRGKRDRVSPVTKVLCMTSHLHWQQTMPDYDQIIANKGGCT